MSVTEELQRIIDALCACATDAAKHERGNHAAGTRIRKALQATVHDCRELRQSIQDERNATKN
jgi:hypothetical protein